VPGTRRSPDPSRAKRYNCDSARESGRAEIIMPAPLDNAPASPPPLITNKTQTKQTQKTHKNQSNKQDNHSKQLQKQ
jgi:hypothetical protein